MFVEVELPHSTLHHAILIQVLSQNFNIKSGLFAFSQYCEKYSHVIGSNTLFHSNI
jgi:hypothetical protein